MERDECAVLDLSEGNTEQAEVPALTAVLAGEVTDAEEGSTEPEPVWGMDSPVHGAALEPSPESDEVAAAGNGADHGAALGSITNEDSEVFENPIVTHFGFRALAANATPPSTFRRLPSRSRKSAVPTNFIVEGAAGLAGSETPVLGASSSAPAPVTGTYEDVSSLSGGDQGPAPGDDKRQKQACFASGAMVAIAHASPPDSYRLQPSRSRKQSSSTRFIAVGAPTSAGGPAAGDPPAPTGLGSTLPSVSASGLHTATRSASDATAPKASSDVKAESASSSRLSYRGRKHPRAEHFIPEEGEARARTKARRSNIVLDRFLSSLVHGSSEPRPEWVRNVTAEAVRGQRQRSFKGFRIRDVSHHAARVRELSAAIGLFGATGGDPSSSARPGCASAAAPGSPPGEPDGSGTIYGVLAVLGNSLALSVVSCVLFYIVGQRSESDPSGEQEKK